MILRALVVNGSCDGLIAKLVLSLKVVIMMK
jgi:hypothetical protein